MCANCYQKVRETDTLNHIPCVNCHTLNIIYAFDMCRKCYRKTPQQRETGNVYQKLYLLRNPEKVENKRLWAKGYYQRPEVKEIKRVYYQLYNQKPEVKARDRVGGRNQNRIIRYNKRHRNPHGTKET